MSGMSTEQVLTLLQQVAAEIITPRFRDLADHHVSEKAPGSLVTIADHEAEVAITDALHTAYPEAVVLGEEAYEADHSILADYAIAEHAFTVDPVDGTRNFVHGSADHAVMVAELVGGRTTRAWIWQPEHAVAWTAELGAGAFRNGERQHRRPVPSDTPPTKERLPRFPLAVAGGASERAQVTPGSRFQSHRGKMPSYSSPLR